MTGAVIYLSGPMTGLPVLNRPLFAQTAQALRSRGLVVVSPHELCRPSWGYWRCLLVDLWHLCRCDAIYLLPGWVDSRGARIERALALLLGHHVHVAPTP